MKIYIGADHAGYEMKEMLRPYLEKIGFTVVDCGAHRYDPNDDYPDFIVPVVEAVAYGSGRVKGIILGGSGQGEAIVANRFPGVRAVVFNGQYKIEGKRIPNEIKLSREHNDSNILSLGARFLSDKDAKDAVKLWVSTPFSNQARHKRRIAKIEEVGKTRICQNVVIRTNLLPAGKKKK